MPDTKIPENELNSNTELSDDNEEKRVSLLHQEFHAGPLPSPDTLKKYNDILPDAADRIFKMAEKSQGKGDR
jgi:uncharacterized membrane protein